MTFEELRELDRQYVIQSYGRGPIAIHHGQGAVLYGLDGREYIDFASGIGVLSVGTADPKWVEAVTEQAGRLGHISNLYYSEPYVKLAETLCTRSGMAAAFFGNSGAEANEGLIKLARKWSWEKYGEGRGTIITLNRSFHGRTITTLAATGQDVFHKYFFPFTEGFRRADPDLDSVKQAAGHDVCAVLVELVQGEGGVLPLDPDF
ncbi:MAG: aminotransferase class III-fold pyridoxal phosphate-dependent enzyme, partial [Oscillospiraceae bacterium]|nr:aminotransferase class III-fold pyridoxal phosphate-dependent enzyme [Oscillospiraceae bacterium]